MDQDATRPAAEPAPDATEATDAGSVSSRTSPPQARSQPALVNDVLRALICAVLLGTCVGEPASALLFAPFIPLLVALRVARHRGGVRRFLVIATAASLGAAAVSVTGLVDVTTTEGFALTCAALLAALLAVPGLGLLHVRAVRHDPARAGADVGDWPEPRIDSGITLATAGWALVVALLAAGVLPVIGSVTGMERDVAERAYSVYVDACAPGGTLAAREAFCDSIMEQRDATLQLIEDVGNELLAALLAAVAFGGAATTHLLALVRLRHVSDRIRPAWRLRDLESHWASAYLVAIGLLAVLLGSGGSDLQTVVRSVGVGIGTLGALLVVCSGLGLVTWLLVRPRVPGWYRAFVIVGSLFMLPVALTVLFALGVVDQWLHPRRRAARSASLDDRGSGR